MKRQAEHQQDEQTTDSDMRKTEAPHAEPARGFTPPIFQIRASAFIRPTHRVSLWLRHELFGSACRRSVFGVLGNGFCCLALLRSSRLNFLDPLDTKLDAAAGVRIAAPVRRTYFAQLFHGQLVLLSTNTGGLK